MISAVAGTWQPWGSWSQCSATCGQGSRLRIRACNGFTPGGGHCSGDPAEAQLCQTVDCEGFFCTCMYSILYVSIL